jgi:hypothetical protein
MKAYLYSEDGWSLDRQGPPQPTNWKGKLRNLWLHRSKLLSTKKRPVSHHRQAIELLWKNNAVDYNKALKVHSLARHKGSQRMKFMDHAKAISASDFPYLMRLRKAQLYLKEDPPLSTAKILACFTDSNWTLNVPIPCFHSVAHQYFDGIAYFFDATINYYQESYPAVVNAIQALGAITPNPVISLLGTSSGASVVFRFPEKHSIFRRLSASPPFLRDPLVCEMLRQGDFHAIHNSRIFYAASNSMDSSHYAFLQSVLPPDMFREKVNNIDWISPCHGTLTTVMAIGCLEDQLRWLSGVEE